MIIKYNSKELDLMARLMRAEALGEGDLGMLMVGNVIINRALANCLTFKNVKTIEDVVMQNPGGFSGTNSPLFQSRSNESEKRLAKRCIDGEKFYPASSALWFYSPIKDCKKEFYGEPLVGNYKNHCFYKAKENECYK